MIYQTKRLSKLGLEEIKTLIGWVLNNGKLMIVLLKKK